MRLVPLVLLSALLLTLGCAHAASDQRALARFQEDALAQHDRVFFLAARTPSALGLDAEGARALRDLKAEDRVLREETRALAREVEAGDLAGPTLRARLLGLRARRSGLEARADELYARIQPAEAVAQLTLAARAALPEGLELVRLVLRVDGRELARATGLGAQPRGLARVWLPPGAHVVRAHAWLQRDGVSYALARALAVDAKPGARPAIFVSLAADPDGRPRIELERAR